MQVGLKEEAAWSTLLVEPAPAAISPLHLGAGLAADTLNLSATTAPLTITGLKTVCFAANSTLLHTPRGLVAESNYLMDQALLAEPLGPDFTDIPDADRLVIGYNKPCYNYYHWIVQNLTAIYCYTLVADRGRPTVLLPPPYKAFQRQSLELAALEIDTFTVALESTYRLPEVEVSNCLTGALDYAPSPLIKPLFDRIKAAARAVCGPPGPRARRLVYVSRTDSVLRVMVNEEAVIALMRRNNFHIAVLTELSFAEQVTLFAEAYIIVAPHGAGLTNIAFCDPCCMVYELTPDHYVNACFINLARVQGVEYWIDRFPSLDGDATHMRGWMADLSLIERRLEEILEAAYCWVPQPAPLQG